MLRSKNPYLAFARAIDLFYQPPQYAAGRPSDGGDRANAEVGDNAHVGAYVVIDEDVEIGDDAVLLPHVVIYRGARIGNNFFAHAHAVVREYCILGDNVILQNGADRRLRRLRLCARRRPLGKDHAVRARRCWRDDVEVQANSCVDRASIGETRIGRGAKIDNLVQVGHGSAVGENTLLCSQVGLAGSTRGRQERNSGGASRRRGTLQNRRRRDRHRAERHARRHSRRESMVSGIARLSTTNNGCGQSAYSIDSRSLPKRCAQLSLAAKQTSTAENEPVSTARCSQTLMHLCFDVSPNDVSQSCF